MSFVEVLQELPNLSVAERQLVVRWALELDDVALGEKDDEALIAARLQAHRKNPKTISLDSMKTRLRSQPKL